MSDAIGIFLVKPLRADLLRKFCSPKCKSILQLKSSTLKKKTKLHSTTMLQMMVFS
uniref:Uncharacterized protein n=1 Tax=Arundo donax TaxID=35708 RepID=A0A0A9DVD6_ARUDO